MTEALRGILRRLRLPSRSIKRFPKISSVVSIIGISLIVILAFLVRIQPMKWGIYLYEFDPYLQYKVTKYILENGFPAWFHWHDNQSWYPEGRDMAASTYPGLPLMGAFLYSVASFFGIRLPLLQFLTFVPPFLAAIASLAMYYLGKDYGGRAVGLFSAFFMAVGPSYVARTFLGWYDDESVGILSLILMSLFYLRSLEDERSFKGSVVYALLSGLSLGYLCISWGAFRYALGLLALSSFILFLLRFSRRLLVSYGITMGLGLLGILSIPRGGLAFASEITFLASIGLFFLFLARELIGRLGGQKPKLIAWTSIALVLFLGAYGLWRMGYLNLPGGKFMAVIFPPTRTPIIESVGEHQPATWASYFSSFGILTFLAPIFFLFVLWKPNIRNLYLATFLATSIYFAATFVRLEIILAPALYLAGAYVLMELLKPLVENLRPRAAMAARGRFFVEGRFGKEVSAALIIILMVLILFPGNLFVSMGVQMAQSPATIASSSIPVRAQLNDWIQTLAWIRDNLPEDAVVASWWDYGYWLTILGNKTTLVDNATIDTVKIARIAKMFLSSEKEAVKILKEYNVSYVVVFVDFWAKYPSYGLYISGGYGEENKYYRMVQIANQVYGGYNITEYWQNGFTSKFENTTLGKMIPFKLAPYTDPDTGAPLYMYTEFLDSDYFSLAYASPSLRQGGSTTGWAGGVAVYRVHYDSILSSGSSNTTSGPTSP
jgi:dolichyl-diphosphooligosaccharide--protein glycosyltransferase